MIKERELLLELLNCGYRDLEFLLNFNYPVEDIITKTQDMGLELNNINNLIYGAFQLFLDDVNEIVSKHHQDLELEFDVELDAYEDFEMYINYFDSSIWVKEEMLEIYQSLLPELNNLCYEKLRIYLW